MDVVENQRLRHEHDADFALYGPRLPDVRVRVRPLRHFAAHLHLRRRGSVHGETAECAEQRTVEQGPPAGIEDARSSQSHRNQVPQTHVLRIGNAAVLAGTPSNLRLHPERSGLRLRMIERLPTSARTRIVHDLKLLPGLVAGTRGDPGVPGHIHVGGRPPIIPRGPLKLHPAPPAVGADRMVLVEAAEQRSPTAEQFHRIVLLKLDPVDHGGIARSRARHVDEFPFREAIAVPGLLECVERLVFRLEPLPEFRLGLQAVASLYVILVPKVEAHRGRVLAIALHKRGLESLGRSEDIRVVVAHWGGSGCSAVVHAGIQNGTVDIRHARIRILVEHPLRGRV